MAKRTKVPQYTGVYYRIQKRLGGHGTERVYYITFKIDGVDHEEKAGRQYADGMTPARAALVRAERMEGKRPSPKEVREAKKEINNKSYSLDSIYSEYKKMFPDRKNNANFDGILDNHLAGIKDMQISELTTKMVDDIKFASFKKGLSNQTVHHILGMIKLLVNFADKYGYVDKPPSSQLRFNMPHVDNQKTENMTDVQFKTYLKALDDEPDQNAANCLRLALLTGMRRTALFNLKWTDIDFENSMIVLRGEVAKKGKTEIIPMSSEAKNILENERDKHINSTYVFPGIDGGPRKELRRVARRVREKAGLPKDFRPMHGLRHTFASHLASSGKVDLYTIQKLLTHSKPEMTQRYAHLANETMRNGANVFSDIYQKEKNNQDKKDSNEERKEQDND